MKLHLELLLAVWACGAVVFDENFGGEHHGGQDYGGEAEDYGGEDCGQDQLSPPEEISMLMADRLMGIDEVLNIRGNGLC